MVNTVNYDSNLFPNPAYDLITINTSKFLSDNSYHIEIINIQNEIIFREKITDETTNINIKDFANGCYFVLIKNENNIIVYKNKFVKN